MNLDLMLPQPVVADAYYAFVHSNFVSGKLFVGLLFVVSIYAWAVMVAKWLVFKRAKRAGKYFIAQFRKEKHPLALFLKQQPIPASPLLKVYEGACTAVGIELESRGNETAELFVRGLDKNLKLNPYQLTAIRNAAERAIADQALPDVLDRALLMRITEPPPPRPRSPGAFHHGLADSGKRR